MKNPVSSYRSLNHNVSFRHDYGHLDDESDFVVWTDDEEYYGDSYGTKIIVIAYDFLTFLYRYFYEAMEWCNNLILFYRLLPVDSLVKLVGLLKNMWKWWI